MATETAARSPIVRRQHMALPISELMQKPALTLRECAQVLNISVDLISKLIAQGGGPAVFMIGRVRYVRTETLKLWLRKVEAEALAQGEPVGVEE